LIADGGQAGAGLRSGAGEQRDFVAKLHESVAKVGDDTLGAAIEFWRHRLV
jgi:hypothetical protein